MRRFPPVGARRGVVVLGHAMMATSSYLAPMAAHLASRGLEAWTFDFRGHGGSVPPSPHRHRWSFDDYARHDVPAVLAAARDAGVPVGWIGHSLGGLAALAAIGAGYAPAPARLVLVATAPWIRGGPGRLFRLTVATLLAAAARPLGYLPVRRLRAGTSDEPASYLGELAGWVRSQRWPYLDGVARIRTPALVVVGDADRYCRDDDARVVADRLGGPVAWRRVPGANHFGFFRAQPRLWDELAAFFSAS